MRVVWTVGISIALITFLIYLPSLQNDFVNWDDDKYVYENWNIRSIDPAFLLSFYYSNWHPLTMLSYALDYAVWSLNPMGYHLTNVVFHAANTFLAFILTLRLVECGLTQNPKLVTRNFSLIAASVTALLFGIHPLHVESVAWVSERKDVLYAFFFLLSIVFYIKYVSSDVSRRSIFYSACLITFVLSLMSKPMAVTLPIILLILDYYPLARLTAKRDTYRSLIEKIPFFAFSLLSALITIWAQGQNRALWTVEESSLTERIFTAAHAYILYLVKMSLPFNLAPLYPNPARTDLLAIEYLGSFILLIAISIFCILSLKRYRLFSAAWLYYLITLIPAIGIVKVGGHSMADRYTYLPSLGPFLLAGIGIAIFLEKQKAGLYRHIIIVVLLLMAIFLGAKTIGQIAIWKDSITLWSHEIKVFPYVTIAYYDRGIAYHSKGKYDRAIEDYDKAIDLKPDYFDAYNTRGIAYYSKGQYDEAIKDYDKVIDLNPDYIDAYINRGNVYNSKGQYDRAIEDYDKAIALDPNHAKAHNNRGIAYYKKGQNDRAISDFQKACDMGNIDGCESLRWVQ